MKRTRLRLISTKRSKQMAQYRTLKTIFLKDRKYCEIFEPCCTRKATDIHHVNGRNGIRLLDMTWWLPTCRSCHDFIHQHPKYAREAGFLK